MNQLSTFLCANPSFLGGMARVLDLGSTLNEYNACPTGEQADFIALWSDWRLVGIDIKDATCEYAQKRPEVRIHGRFTRQGQDCPQLRY
jgi:hypothetical protein